MAGMVASVSRPPCLRALALLAAVGLLAHSATAQASDGDPALASFTPREAVRQRQVAVRLQAVPPVDDFQGLAPRQQPLGCPWTAAAREGRDAELRTAARRGADLDCLADDGFTPLAAAAFAGMRSTVRLLVQAGANLRRQTSTGQTPLHLAALAGQVEVIDELLRGHAHVEMLNSARDSALDVAAQAGQDAAMDRLLRAGADSTRAGRR
jgi:hypothetical protein